MSQLWSSKESWARNAIQTAQFLFRQRHEPSEDGPYCRAAIRLSSLRGSSWPQCDVPISVGVFHGSGHLSWAQDTPHHIEKDYTRQGGSVQEPAGFRRNFLRAPLSSSTRAVDRFQPDFQCGLQLRWALSSNITDEQRNKDKFKHKFSSIVFSCTCCV